MKVVNPSLYYLYEKREKEWQVFFTWDESKIFESFPSREVAKKFAVEYTIKNCPEKYKTYLWVEY